MLIFSQSLFSDSRIVSLAGLVPARPEAPLILPGFINIHFHGLGKFGMLSLEELRGMAEFSPQTGVTSFLPTLASCAKENENAFLENVKTLMRDGRKGARCLGAHLEGPYLSVEQKGGMAEEYLRTPNRQEVEEILRRAEGCLRLMTLAPEIPNGLETVRRLREAGVTVSVGHSACTPEIFAQAVEAGAAHVCHLFDAYAARKVVDGITQFSLADACLLDDRVTVELIMDGFHVPVPLLKLAVKCAGPGRIVGITDSMQGTGLPNGIYYQESGEEYYLDNESLCRTTKPPYCIVGSCLTMLKAFQNMVLKFGFSIPDASRMLSGNPARTVGAEHETGALREGLLADVNVLEGPEFRLKECIVAGQCRIVNGEQSPGQKSGCV